MKKTFIIINPIEKHQTILAIFIITIYEDTFCFFAMWETDLFEQEVFENERMDISLTA